jgi:hypothetical protein
MPVNRGPETRPSWCCWVLSRFWITWPASVTVVPGPKKEMLRRSGSGLKWASATSGFASHSQARMETDGREPWPSARLAGQVVAYLTTSLSAGLRAGWGDSYEFGVVAEESDLGTVRDAQLGQDMGDVRLHRGYAHMQRRGDLGVRLAFSDSTGDLMLAGAEGS